MSARGATIDIVENETRLDPVLLGIAAAIFAVVIFLAYIFWSPMSVAAMGLGGIVVIYQLMTIRGKLGSKFKYKDKLPSSFFFFLVATPIGVGIVTSLGEYSISASVQKAVLIWGLTLTFWSTLLFVPMAIYSKYRESFLSPLQVYPSITVIVPAYNEEKVIRQTIEALIVTNYPKKEIIVIDDGSSDNTLKVANAYNKKIKVLHKDNGGKASAINYGLAFSSSEIIVVVDADTIIGRNSLSNLARGFLIDKDVVAIAGNIKIRNRVNWLTSCQAVEYLTGIQLVRRTFNVFGTIPVVPGALGAFKKSALENVGSYHKDTIVEDFDVTMKILKTKLVVQGSTNATAYTEAPESLKNLYKQRKRWYGGNMQVYSRHMDALVNPRFGLLQRLVFPYILFSSVIMPFVGLVTIASAAYMILTGGLLYILEMFSIFCMLQCLQVALTVRMDREDPYLIPYGIFLVVGYKQILDILLIKATFERLFKKEMKWTSAERIGVKI